MIISPQARDASFKKKTMLNPYYSTEILPSSPFIYKIFIHRIFSLDRWKCHCTTVFFPSLQNHHRSPTQVPYQEMFLTMPYDVLFSVIVSDYTIPSSRLSDQLFTMEHVPSVVSLNLGLGVIALHYQK